MIQNRPKTHTKFESKISTPQNNNNRSGFQIWKQSINYQSILNEINSEEIEEKRACMTLRKELERNKQNLVQKGKMNLQDLKNIKKKCDRNLFQLENRVLTPCTDFYINKKFETNQKNMLKNNNNHPNQNGKIDEFSLFTNL